MNRARKDPNLKVPFESVEQLRKINEKLIDIGFDNIKVLNSIAIDELDKVTKTLTKKELFNWISTKTSKLQNKGIVRNNARNIGKSKKWAAKIAREEKNKSYQKLHKD